MRHERIAAFETLLLQVSIVVWGGCSGAGPAARQEPLPFEDDVTASLVIDRTGYEGVHTLLGEPDATRSWGRYEHWIHAQPAERQLVLRFRTLTGVLLEWWWTGNCRYLVEGYDPEELPLGYSC